MDGQNVRKRKRLLQLKITSNEEHLKSDLDDLLKGEDTEGNHLENNNNNNKDDANFTSPSKTEAVAPQEVKNKNKTKTKPKKKKTAKEPKSNRTIRKPNKNKKKNSKSKPKSSQRKESGSSLSDNNYSNEEETSDSEYHEDSDDDYSEGSSRERKKETPIRRPPRNKTKQQTAVVPRARKASNSSRTKEFNLMPVYSRYNMEQEGEDSGNDEALNDFIVDDGEEEDLSDSSSSEEKEADVAQELLASSEEELEVPAVDDGEYNGIDEEDFIVDDNQPIQYYDKSQPHRTQNFKRLRKNEQQQTSHTEFDAVFGTGKQEEEEEEDADWNPSVVNDNSNNDNTIHYNQYEEEDPELDPTKNVFHVAVIKGEGLESTRSLIGMYHNEKTLKKLLNQEDRDGVTPLLYAAERGVTEVVKLFLKHGASMDAEDKYEQTIEHYAARGSLECLLTIAQQRGQFAVDVVDTQDASPLHCAAAAGKSDVCVELIQRGADINARDIDDATPLMYAAGAGHAEVVQQLILHKAEVNLQEAEGSTALHVCAANGFMNCLKVLILEGRANVEISDSKGWPPLMYADFKGNREGTVLLLEANPHQLSLLGKLMRDETSRPVVLSILEYIATIPAFYGILNNFLRENVSLLNKEFSFLLEKKQLLDFDNKKHWFQEQMAIQSFGRDISGQSQLEVTRAKALEDSLVEFMYEGSVNPRKKPFRAVFRGEPGFGAGVRREYFQVLSQQIVSPERGLFRLCPNHHGYEINPLSSQTPHTQLEYLHFTGFLIGLALYHEELLQIHFTRPLLKQLLHLPITWKDMDYVDSAYYKSLQWIMDNNVTDDLGSTFTIEVDESDPLDNNTTNKARKTKTIELIKNGSNVEVTEQNKAQFVRLAAEYKLVVSVEEKLNRLEEGLAVLIDSSWLRIFNENELELLISGLAEIDFEDWRRNTVYSGFSSEDKEIQWFWGVVGKMSSEERALLLKFVTGSSCVPMGGFAELMGYGQKQKFQIVRLRTNEKQRLPSASTCFNSLKLPEYESYEQLQDKLFVAIKYGGEGFSFS